MTKYFAMVLLLCGVMLAQDAPPPPPPAGPGGGHRQHIGPGGPDGRGGPLGALGGRWWKQSEIVQELGLSQQQISQIEQIFQTNQPQLKQNMQALHQQEDQLRSLLNADQPVPAQVNAQIDQIAQSRAALEKAHAQMLLAVRGVLTAEQWQKLQQKQEQFREKMQERMQERRNFRKPQQPADAPPKPQS
jgi:Spy/CpxP family protein refolding chaperone